MKVRIKVLPNRNAQLWQGDQLLKEFDCGMHPDRGLELLSRINQLKDFQGNPIYTNYQWRGHYLWGLHQEELFKRFCLTFTQYKALFEFLNDQQLTVASCEDSSLSNLNDILEIWQPGYEIRPKKGAIRSLMSHGAQKILWLAITAAAFLKVKIHNTQLGLYSYDHAWGPIHIDRRLKDVHQHLQESNFPYLELFANLGPVSLRNFFTRKRLALYYPPVLSKKQDPAHVYDLSGLSKSESKLFLGLLPILEAWMKRDCDVAPKLLKSLQWLGLKKIYSVDDYWTTGPLILACREGKIELIAIAHAFICQYHQGHLQSGIPRQNTCGFPKVLVWGEAFRQFVLNHGNQYTSDEVIAAGHLRPLSLKPKKLQERNQNKPFTLLYPYEFLADFPKISEFLNAFSEKGYKIYFKSRWDSSMSQHFENIPQDKLHFVDEIDQALLEELDVCVGTQSSILYDLYQVGVPIWYLETASRFLAQTVEFGIAPSISLEQVKNPEFDPEKWLIPPKAGFIPDEGMFRFIHP